MHTCMYNQIYIHTNKYTYLLAGVNTCNKETEMENEKEKETAKETED